MSKYIRLSEFDAAAFKNFDGSETVISDRFVMFWKPPSPFGQWTRSPFTIDNKLYQCAEQYMMAEKARLFGDLEIEAKIMQTDDPKLQKKLGKQARGFDGDLWDSERCKIVFRGNMAKFTQNPHLLRELSATGSRLLVEASPFDRIWGIGFAANDPNAYVPDKWVGLNLLGKVLSEVRDRLAVDRD